MSRAPRRSTVLRAALRVFDLFVTSPARTDEDDASGSLVAMYVANLFDIGTTERFRGWSHDAMRKIIAAWIEAAPTCELDELRDLVDNEITFLDYFENDRHGEIRGGPVDGARQLVKR